jgi:cell wall-associated NlpC family hydrolase
MTPSPSGRGYWLFAGDGGVFTFGDATFYGSTGAIRLNQPIIGMAATPTGKGYWLYAADGGIFTFGDAVFYGSTGAIRLNRPIVSMTSTPSGHGYWLVAGDGGLFSFGDATFLGSTGAQAIVQPIVRLVTTPDGLGYWEVARDGSVYPFGEANGGTNANGDTPTLPVMGLFHTVTGAADSAVEWAMAQLGKPYQWGGIGPGSFDCSGLVYRAWGSVGVTLPRGAIAQYSAGPNVAIAALIPGDLVFWADDPVQPSTIHHVAIYLGNGNMVDAPHTGTVVSISSIGGTGFVQMGTRP